MRKGFWLVTVAAMLTVACGGKKENEAENSEYISMEQNEPGDSTVYGLACDGCSDTILVFLPWTGGDPDTIYILNATKEHQVFGRPMIGDKLAVVMNKENPKMADLVVDLEELKGEWCYLVKPQLRERAGMSETAQRHELREANDTMFKELMQPREYGVEIKSEHIARPIGITRTMTSDEESPVVFPPLKRYSEWRILNGRLILNETTRDTLGTVTVTNSDTATFVLLRRDTLVLRFNDGEQGFYRRNEE